MFGRKKKAKVAGTAALGGGKVAGRVARGAGKAAAGGGKVFLKSPKARKVVRGAGKAAIKGGARAITPREPATTRFLKYGFFAIAGFTVGALIARAGKETEVSAPWGSETPFGGTPGGAPGGVTDVGTTPAEHQRPEDPNRTGAEREYSDPSAGPLIGRRHGLIVDDVPEQQEEIEQRIRSRVGEDPRTLDLARLNVEVNDGVADIRGEVHSEEEKQAVDEIARETEGITEVRNLLTVNPNAPRRHS